MKNLLDILMWDESTLNKDGSVRIAPCSGMEFNICIQSPKKNIHNQKRLSTLLEVGNYLLISDKINEVKYTKPSPFSISFYFLLILKMIGIITGSNQDSDKKVFDDVLALYDNPKTSEGFPFNQKLKILRVNTDNMLGNDLLANGAGVVVLDEENDDIWGLSAILFCHVKYIYLS